MVDALRLNTVFVHPYAGVLSAFGMGLADIRAPREAQWDRLLVEFKQAREALDVPPSETRAEVTAQGIADIEVARTGPIRAGIALQTLPVPFGPKAERRAAFDAAHRQRFGF